MKTAQKNIKTVLPSIGRRSKRRPRAIEIDNLIISAIADFRTKGNVFFTQEDIANAIGVDKSDVCQCIKRLLKANKIKRQKRSIELLRSLGWIGSISRGQTKGYLYSL